MTKAAIKEVSGRKSEETVSQTKDSSGPIWKTQHNRVQGAMWKHDQSGKTRYTVSISRSYKDEKGKWALMGFVKEGDDWKMTLPQTTAPVIEQKPGKTR